MNDPTRVAIDSTPFYASAGRLADPDPHAVREAVEALPRRGSLEITCSWTRLGAVLAALESSGCIAIELRAETAACRWRVSALKGKAGACFETGRSATYLGGAAAAVDDDGHLLFGDMRVCEKTAGLYTLPPYRHLINVSAADPSLLARLETAPIPFDCNTFGRDAAALAQRLQFRLPAAAEASAFVYAGPFRLLVLADGAVLRRGEPLLLTAAQRLGLNPAECIIPAAADAARMAKPPDSFPARYAREGAVCLIAPMRASAPETIALLSDPPAVGPDLSALARASTAMRVRLAAMIERSDPYFIVTGSDPRTAGGCCPCEEAGEANRLVEAGLLARYVPPSHPDACTTAVYAMTGEIHIEGEPPRPVFAVNSALRAAVARLLV